MAYYGVGGQNGDFPYGRGGGFDLYGNGYGRYDPAEYQRKKAADKSVRIKIFCTSAVVCSGVCFYVLLSNLYSRIITHFPALYDRYVGPTPFGSICDMLYSFVCVGLPFLLIFLFFKFFDGDSADIRFGGAYDGKNAVLLVLAGLGMCFIGNIIDSVIINFFGGLGIEFYSYREAAAGVDAPSGITDFVVSAVRTAVVPALIEEFAFRGVVLGALRKYGDGFAIAMSALLFGLMHGNFTQVPFAIIAGTALGFICVVTGSIWPSVILHFCNNFISVVYGVAVAAAGTRSVLVSSVITYGIIFIGAAAFVVYLIRNKNGLRLRPGRYAATPGKPLAFILSPTFLLGAGALIQNMIDDIVV